MKKLNNKGFSLVELLVVIAIMVVLVGVVAPSLLRNVEKARESKDVQTLDTIAGAIQSSIASEKGYDAALDPTNGIFKNGTVVDVYGTIKTNTTNSFCVEFNASLSLSTLSSDFGSKLAKATNNKVWAKIDGTTGRVTVFIATASDGSAASNSNVTLSVTR